MSCVGDWLCSKRIKNQSSCNFGCWARAVLSAMIFSKAKLPRCPCLLDPCLMFASVVSYLFHHCYHGCCSGMCCICMHIHEPTNAHTLFTLGSVTFRGVSRVTLLCPLFLQIFNVCFASWWSQSTNKQYRLVGRPVYTFRNEYKYSVSTYRGLPAAPARCCGKEWEMFIGRVTRWLKEAKKGLFKGLVDFGEYVV